MRVEAVVQPEPFRVGVLENLFFRENSRKRVLFPERLSAFSLLVFFRLLTSFFV